MSHLFEINFPVLKISQKAWCHYANVTYKRAMMDEPYRRSSQSDYAPTPFLLYVYVYTRTKLFSVVQVMMHFISMFHLPFYFLGKEYVVNQINVWHIKKSLNRYFSFRFVYHLWSWNVQVTLKNSRLHLPRWSFSLSVPYDPDGQHSLRSRTKVLWRYWSWLPSSTLGFHKRIIRAFMLGSTAGRFSRCSN